jgi:hypothetical protein
LKKRSKKLLSVAQHVKVFCFFFSKKKYFLPRSASSAHWRMWRLVRSAASSGGPGNIWFRGMAFLGSSSFLKKRTKKLLSV